MKLMKGIVVTEKNVVKVADDIPVPELGPYDCLCRVRACGFCTGTDFGIIFKFFSKIEDTVEFAPILGEDGTAIAGGGDGGNHVNIEHVAIVVDRQKLFHIYCSP